VRAAGQPPVQAAPTPSQPPTQQPQVIPAEAIGMFVGQLDQAIRSGVVAPRQFAEGFIQHAGPQVANQVIAAVSADVFIEFVNGQPAGQQTAIVTRAGQKYVRAVWDEAVAIINQMAGAAA
jgi:hypothetical protein